MLPVEVQNLILGGVVADTRRCACPHAPRTTIPELRAALRLDDLKLSLIIADSQATGLPLRWTTEVTACPQS